MIPPVSLVLATRANDYVAALGGVGAEGDTTLGLLGWVELFLSATGRACHDADGFSRDLAQLDADGRVRLGRVRANSAVDLLVSALPALPVFSVTTAAAHIGRSFPVTADAVERLRAANVVKQVTLGRRNRTFEAVGLFEAFTGGSLKQRATNPEVSLSDSSGQSGFNVFTPARVHRIYRTKPDHCGAPTTDVMRTRDTMQPAGLDHRTTPQLFAMLWALTVTITLTSCTARTSPISNATALPSTRPTTSVAGPSRAHGQGRPILSPPVLNGATWHRVGSIIDGVPATYTAALPSSSSTLLWMNPAVLRFRFIPGTLVPESSPATTADNKPATWVPRLAAAFNGGFWLKDLHSGGYFYDGKVVQPLVAGQAAIVVTRSGRLSVVMWGRDVTLGPDVVAVRENLPLLVDSGRDNVGAMRGRGAWGRSANGPATSNRSALGQLADGSLVYEYGYRVTAEQMAQGLLLVRARTGIMLDMNGSWPAAFVYTHKGALLIGQRIQPQIYHDPSLYYTRYKKDFVAAVIR